MISEERLKELIKQGVIIYQIKKEPLIAGYSNTVKIEELPLKKYHNISVEKYNKLNNCKPHLYKGGDYMVFEKVAELEDLFETKEDAEEYLEFENVTREERLYTPSYKDFKNGQAIRFHCYPCDYECNTDLVNIYIREFFGFGGKDLYIKPLTKENYLEARRMCVKLFKGE